MLAHARTIAARVAAQAAAEKRQQLDPAGPAAVAHTQLPAEPADSELPFEADSHDESDSTHSLVLPDGLMLESNGVAPPKGCSVYERLRDVGLLRKITDIVLAKVAIPWHLRDDAKQEIHAAWAMLPVKEHFQRNQLGNYAYLSGKHAALKLRRTLGAVCVIPGALFRSGRNSAFAESIGAAVNPKDVDDYTDSIELSVEPVELLKLAKVTESFLAERLSGLTLTAKQRIIAHKALVERMAVDDIAAALQMEVMYVERMLNQVTAKLEQKDANCDGKAPAGNRTSAAAPRRTRAASSRATRRISGA